MNRVSGGCGLAVWDQGNLVPRNDAMASLLDRLGSADPEEWLVATVADRERLRHCLQHGGECSVALGAPADPDASPARQGRRVPCRGLAIGAVREIDGSLWVALSDQTSIEDLQATVTRLSSQQLVGSVLAGVVHDLNNLVMRFFGVAEAVMPLARSDSERSFFEMMTRAADRDVRMLRRVSDLLDPGHDSSRSSDAMHTPNPGELVSELARLVARDCVAKDGFSSWSVECDVADGVPAVAVGEDVLTETVLGLLVFLRASAGSGGSLTVRVSAVPVPVAPEVSVVPARPATAAERAEVVFSDSGEREPLRQLAWMLGDPPSGDRPRSVLGSAEPTDGSESLNYEGVLASLAGLGIAGGACTVTLEDPSAEHAKGRRTVRLQLPAERSS